MVADGFAGASGLLVAEGAVMVAAIAVWVDGLFWSRFDGGFDSVIVEVLESDTYISLSLHIHPSRKFVESHQIESPEGGFMRQSANPTPSLRIRPHALVFPLRNP